MKGLLLSIALILLSPAGGLADLLIALDSPYQGGVAGDELTFSGVITNLDPLNTLYLNNFDLNLAGNDFTTDGLDPFFADVPIFLTGGANSGDITLFTVSINNPLSDLPGTWDGAYTLLGGVDGNAQNIIGAVPFSVTTVGTPEPASFGLFWIGMVLLGVRRIIPENALDRSS